MRKIMKMAAALMCTAFVLLGTSFDSSAAEVVESTGITPAELETKERLTFGVEKTAVVDATAGEDWYRFDVTGTGYFQLKMGPAQTADASLVNGGWTFSVYRADNLTSTVKSYSGIKASNTTPVLALGKGTYYVKVAATTSYLNPKCEYSLQVNFTPDSAFESEENDTELKANQIEVNKTYKGTLWNGGDVDWYKVNVTQSGYFQILFTVDSSVDSNSIKGGWTVDVYDKNVDKKIASYTNITRATNGIVLPYAKGTYYVKVHAYLGYNAPKDDCIYRLNVKQTASSSWESESNDTQKTADLISLNKTYKGNFAGSATADWYKFKLTANGTIKLKFSKSKNTDMGKVHDGWRVYLYNSKTKELSRYEDIKNSKSATLDLKKGTYYIQVCSEGYKAPTDCEYSLSVSYCKAPGATKVKSVTGGSKKITVKWNKVKDATGYYVYRSTSKNGTYKKIATIKKNSTVSYVDKKSLKKNKTYYYKVAAYTTAKGVTATSNMSSAKSAKIK